MNIAKRLLLVILWILWAFPGALVVTLVALVITLLYNGISWIIKGDKFTNDEAFNNIGIIYTWVCFLPNRIMGLKPD